MDIATQTSSMFDQGAIAMLPATATDNAPGPGCCRVPRHLGELPSILRGSRLAILQGMTETSWNFRAQNGCPSRFLKHRCAFGLLEMPSHSALKFTSTAEPNGYGSHITSWCFLTFHGLYHTVVYSTNDCNQNVGRWPRCCKVSDCQKRTRCTCLSCNCSCKHWLSTLFHKPFPWLPKEAAFHEYVHEPCPIVFLGAGKPCLFADLCLLVSACLSLMLATCFLELISLQPLPLPRFWNCDPLFPDWSPAQTQAILESPSPTLPFGP